MTDAGLVIAGIGVLLTGGGMVAAAVWGVGQINASIKGVRGELKEQMAALRVEVKYLGKSITDLTDKHDTTDTKVEDLTERVIKLEARI